MKYIQVTLTPPESKRIIAMGVKRLPIVQQALEIGSILITLGTTNAYVAEELTGRKIDHMRYAAGYVDEITTVVPQEKRLPVIALRNGKQVDAKGILGDMTSQDVIIKGANAIDPHNVAGVMMANPAGGTTGDMLGSVMAKGINLVIPVGLEKSIPYSVTDIAKRIGIQRCSKATGLPVGMMPLFGTVVTEVGALALLGAEDVFPLSAGGINGGEGSVTLCVLGDRADEIFEIVQKVKEKKGSFES
ncbi:hypothetical protein ANME2D_03299 [Candidatus Methanoperedens nitroreducens]|uniref:Uncharacterized protein n=1 Tax=Candidatus Methanoperedens nitratireducens TaxID=1392998 RepID=A0A062V3J2_9EURY|nr:hypothetical protein [Candidatus Methanoperedens nitroreducens]KCZ70384.1 hypothetical protein ANME2D_03299 [Candidatus Methanoperedens nitroreducens]MDJ1420824.1 hypothetical protein [Candidatus Methanoperedens sp.]